jgi:hypothetical protein
MPAKVSAEGFDVATTMSEHYAHSTEPDVRKPTPTTKKKCKNWQKTDKLGENRSKKTKFGGGDVWRESTKLGPPSEDVDGWPGENNKGKINDEITGAKGSGAKKVFVEKEIVYRHEDLTDQNAFNSKGKIDDKAGWEAYMKIVYEDDDVATDDGSNADANTNANTTPEQAPPKPVDPKPVPTIGPARNPLPCTLQEVSLFSDDQKRKQSGTPKDEKAILEVVGGGKAHLYAKVYQPCDKHVVWKCGSWSVQGLTADCPVGIVTDGAFGAALGGVERTNKGAGAVGAAALNFAAVYALCVVPPKPFVITADACEDHFERTVRVFPTTELKGKLELDKLKEFAKADRLLQKFGEYGFRSLDWKIQLLVGSISASAKWKEDETNWKAYCSGKLEGAVQLIFAEVRLKYRIADWFVPFPIVTLIQKALKGINYLFEKFTGEPAVDCFIFASFGVKISISCAILFKRYYQDGFKFPNYAVGAEGKVEIFLGIGLEAAKKAVEAEGKAGTTISVKGEGSAPIGETFAKIKVWLEWQPLVLSLKFKWDLTKLIPGAGGLFGSLVPGIKGEEKGDLKIGNVQRFDLTEVKL